MKDRIEVRRHVLPIMLEPGSHGRPALYLTDVGENVLYFSNSPSPRTGNEFPVSLGVLDDLLYLLGGALPAGVRGGLDANGESLLIVLGRPDDVVAPKQPVAEEPEETHRRSAFGEWLFQGALAVSRAMAEQADGGH